MIVERTPKREGEGGGGGGTYGGSYYIINKIY